MNREQLKRETRLQLGQRRRIRSVPFHRVLPFLRRETPTRTRTRLVKRTTRYLSSRDRCLLFSPELLSLRNAKGLENYTTARKAQVLARSLARRLNESACVTCTCTCINTHYDAATSLTFFPTLRDLNIN